MRLRRFVSKSIGTLVDYLLGRDVERTGFGEQQALREALERSRQEWVAARHFFENVTDPRLIDYAVFSIGAAERRYMYYMDEARRQGMRVDPVVSKR